MRLSGIQRTVRQTMWMCALLVLSLLFAGSSPAAGRQGTAAPLLTTPEQKREHRADQQQVLSVIEHRTMNEKVRERMREKIFTLSERELHLAASLCERIARDDHSPGSNLAFSIVTAMIVLS